MARKHELPATTLTAAQLAFDGARAVTILQVGSMDNRPNTAADRAGEDMPLLPLIIFSGRIAAARATGHGRLDRLAVDHTRVGLVFSARGLAVHQQHMIVCHTPLLAMHRNSSASSYVAAKMLAARNRAMGGSW